MVRYVSLIYQCSRYVFWIQRRRKPLLQVNYPSFELLGGWINDFWNFYQKTAPKCQLWRGEGLDLVLLLSPNAFVGSIALLGCELA